MLQSSILKPLLRDYLIESNQSDTASLSLLATARARAPESVWPAYLLGRRLYFAHRFDAAILELQQVTQAVVPEDIGLASIELLAWSELRGGQASQARDTVDQALTEFPWTQAERLRLEDLRRRADALLR